MTGSDRSLLAPAGWNGRNAALVELPLGELLHRARSGAGALLYS